MLPVASLPESLAQVRSTMAQPVQKWNIRGRHRCSQCNRRIMEVTIIWTTHALDDEHLAVRLFIHHDGPGVCAFTVLVGIND